MLNLILLLWTQWKISVESVQKHVLPNSIRASSSSKAAVFRNATHDLEKAAYNKGEKHSRGLWRKQPPHKRPRRHYRINEVQFKRLQCRSYVRVKRSLRSWLSSRFATICPNVPAVILPLALLNPAVRNITAVTPLHQTKWRAKPDPSGSNIDEAINNSPRRSRDFTWVLKINWSFPSRVPQFKPKVLSGTDLELSSSKVEPAKSGYGRTSSTFLWFDTHLGNEEPAFASKVPTWPANTLAPWTVGSDTRQLSS